MSLRSLEHDSPCPQPDRDPPGAGPPGLLCTPILASVLLCSFQTPSKKPTLLSQPSSQSPAVSGGHRNCPLPACSHQDFVEAQLGGMRERFISPSALLKAFCQRI